MSDKGRIISEQLQIDEKAFQEAEFDLKQGKNKQTAQRIISEHKKVFDNCIKTISELNDPEKLAPIFQQYEKDIAVILKTLKLQEIDISSEIWQKVLQTMKGKTSPSFDSLKTLTEKQQQIIALK